MQAVLRAVFGGRHETRDYFPLLQWLLLMVVVGFGVVVLAYFGLIQNLLETDHTRISVLILVIFAATSVSCLLQLMSISTELVAARRVREQIDTTTRLQVVDGRVYDQNGREFEPSLMTAHIVNLVVKSNHQGGGRLDQTLLLRSLVDQLRGRERLGWFVSEGLLRLALLGTAIGFILMLIPIAGLTSFDVETLRAALSGMSLGMAIALNVTVTGIACGLILKSEYYILSAAVAELFTTITETTEVRVVSMLERGRDG